MNRNIWRRWFAFGTRLAILACGSVLLQHAVSAATITVTTASDDDDGRISSETTLREAITAANKDRAEDTIVFNIPAGKDRTIDLTTELPHLSSNISIINKGDLVTVQRSFLSFRTPNFRIFTITPGNTVLIEGLVIARGSGGISTRGSSLTLRNCTIQNNFDDSDTASGGGIDNRNDPATGAAGTLVLANCILSGNKVASGSSNFGATGGGAIHNYAFASSGATGQATATLTDCVLRENAVVAAPGFRESGAAIKNTAFGPATATLRMERCLVESNSGGVGAITNRGGFSPSLATVSLTDCTLRNNRGTLGAAIGVLGIHNQEAGSFAVSLTNCTLNDNVAEQSGGAIFSVGKGQISLTNCTLSKNIAGDVTEFSAESAGGAIWNDDATLELTNCTLAANRANNGARAASIYNGAKGSVTTANSIFERINTGNANFFNAGGFSSRGHNICNDAAGGDFGTAPGGLLNKPGDKRNTNAALLALANNGGLTQTHALAVDSPAVNAGDDAIAPPTDQRGFARSGVSDVGAYERRPFTPVAAKPGRLGNISTRLGVETGDNVLIGGFIITGTEPKRVMLRAIGTSLPLDNRLADPVLELFDSSGALIEANDNWIASASKQAIIDSTIPPTSDLESAIVLSLPANGSAYTAVVRGVNDGTGIGLVEVYDLDSTVDSKLANISTRGLVQTGDNVMIAGTIVTGNQSQKVIVRAIGPSLPVAGKLADPALELFDANGALLASNDNWRTGGQEAEITATGVAPSNDFESAIVYQLPSNGASYTATVRGVGDTTGIAVVEVYALATISLEP